MAQSDTIIKEVIDTIFLQNSDNELAIVKDIVEISNSSISNQLSALDNLISGTSLAFGIIGILLGVYIAWLEIKVKKAKTNIEEKEIIIRSLAETVEKTDQKMQSDISKLEKKINAAKESIEEKEKKIISLAETVKETDEKIQSDISGLYSKLRNEESLTLLKRLEEEPQDVNNLFQILAARKLSPELFCHLRTAFCNLLELGDVANEDDGIHCSYRETFLILLCQHYMQNAVKDDRIRKELQSPLTLTKIINSEFKKDIIKTTQDLCLALCDNDCTFDKCGTLVIFLTALNDSKYSELSELKKIFEEKISDKNLLSDAIKKCEQNKNYIKLFGIIPQAEGTNS